MKTRQWRYTDARFANSTYVRRNRTEAINRRR
jgi:hypothetical protein